jgi:hypothetical protein
LLELCRLQGNAPHLKLEPVKIRIGPDNVRRHTKLALVDALKPVKRRFKRKLGDDENAKVDGAVPRRDMIGNAKIKRRKAEIHKLSERGIYCDCKKPYEEGTESPMIKCSYCDGWFHRACIPEGSVNWAVDTLPRKKWSCQHCRQLREI